MMIYVVMAYLVCWLPIHLLTVIGDMNPAIFNSQSVHILWLFSHWLAMSNSASSPLIYFSTNTVYRGSFVDILKRRNRTWSGSDSQSGIFELIKRRISLSVHSIPNLCVDSVRRGTEHIDINELKSRFRISQFRRQESTLAYV